jgi:hypothetical protein
MTVEHPALAGLDAVAWHDLQHAYGSADDTPDLLRRLISGSDEQVGEVFDELWSSIRHQGKVYSASVAAVPFLARLAAVGVQTEGVLRLLGSIAESEDPYGLDDPLAARTAVAEHFDLLAPLAEHGTDEIRAAAVSALANSGPADRALGLLRRRWVAETDPLLRGEVLQAVMKADAHTAGELAEAVLDDESGVLRVCAALALVLAGRPWSDRLSAAGTARIDEPSGRTDRRWEQALFGRLVEAAAGRHGAGVGTDLVVNALSEVRSGSDSALRTALGGARYLILNYRSAAEGLVGPVAGFVGEDDLGQAALGTLALTDARSDATADAVHALAADCDIRDVADHALACLVRWGDSRAWALLARDLTERRSALAAAVGFPGRSAVTGPPFVPEMFDAIRGRLREIAGRTDRPRQRNLAARMASHNEPIHLAMVLQGWGPAAAPALPELIGLLPRHPHPAARALAAIGQAPPECVEALHAAAGSGGLVDRIAVGQALLALTGDPQPLLAIVVDGLDLPSRTAQHAARATAELAEHGDVLVPRLAHALRSAQSPGPMHQDLRGRVELARALCRYTGERADVLPVLHEAFGHSGGDSAVWVPVAAADTVAELGASARAFVPALENMLGHPTSCPAAVHALLSVDPDGTSSPQRREQFADLLVTALAKARVNSAAHRALDVLAELGSPLPAAPAERLRRLAERDRRIATGVVEGEIPREDERLRMAIRALLAR